MLISIAQAAETAGHGADAAHAAHGPFYTDPTFWVAVAFVATVAFLFKKVSAGVTGGLDARRDKIKARIEEAQKLRDEAQELLAQYQRKQRDALKEAEEIVAAAKAEAERLSAQAARDLDELLKRREQQAVDRIAQAEAKAASEVRNVAVDVAVAATRKVIAESMTDKQATGLVDKAIGDLAVKLH